MSRSLLPSNATSKIRPQSWRVYTYYNWWHFKRHCTWTSCDPIQALVRDKCLHAQDTHTHTHALLRHLGGVDNHKDLLNGGGRSSLYQVLLYRPCDKWDCRDGRRGLQCSGSNWNHRMSPGAGPGQAATLSDEPPEAVGVEMNGRMLSFSQN